jgi:hypothetical protein
MRIGIIVTGFMHGRNIMVGYGGGLILKVKAVQRITGRICAVPLKARVAVLSALPKHRRTEGSQNEANAECVSST